MAFRILRVSNFICNAVKQNINFVPSGCPVNTFTSSSSISLIPPTYINNVVRNASFFNKRSGEYLWKGVTSVSSAGRRRGRAKGRARFKNLNRGQVIGVGKVNMLWPGLNSQVVNRSEVIQQRQLPEDPEREAKLIKIRESASSFSRLKLNPLDRGWSGAKLGGRSIGPPDPVEDETFDGFNTRILEYKMVTHMTGNFGRKHSYSVLTVTGNGNGLSGFALGKAPEAKVALRKSKNRAGQKLLYVERYKDHTVLHDFFSQFGKTKIFVSKMPEGYGLVCHRVIKTICEIIGIKDLYAKIEGSKNVQNITKAFFLGLLRQKSHAQLAEEKKLNLVEIKAENYYFPEVVAKPSAVRKAEEIPAGEVIDFQQYLMDGKVILKKKKWPPFYTKYSSWYLKRKKNEYIRNQEDVRIRLRAQYGEIRSFLTEKYPECKPQFWSRKNRAPKEVD